MQAGATDHAPNFYVALGGSGSVGVQPTAALPGGRPTDDGYANDLFEMERSNWADLRLVKLGCPGETTMTMLEGGSHCHYRTGSQLSEALSFLHFHPSTVLMTVDLGFNDLIPCLVRQQVDEACVTREIVIVHEQLAQILKSLQAANVPGLRIIGVGHYDPYLADYLDGPAGRAFAMDSLGAISRLNDVLRSTYADAGIPMADVASVFDISDTAVTTQVGTQTVPEDVARTCTLTWMCTPAPLGPNPHPDDEGYRAISQAIGALVTTH
jgi:hypothetical protein